MARHRRLVSAGLLAAGLLYLGVPAENAFARGRLAESDADVDAAADDMGPPATREAQRRRVNGDDWFRAPVRDSGNYSGVEDFPAEAVHDAVVANAEAAGARMAFRRAESLLAATVRAAQRSLEASVEMRDALAAEKKAYDDYELARNEALRDVVGDPKYVAMQDLRQNLSEQIADKRDSTNRAYENLPRVRVASAGPVVDPGEPKDLVAMATLKMRVGSDARAMERQALLKSDSVRKAQQELAAASAKVSALRAEFDRKVREDPQIAKARQSLEDARVARVVAETYFYGADLAAGEALNFAYWTHRWDYYRYNHSYEPYYGSYYTYPYYGYGHASRRFRSVP